MDNGMLWVLVVVMIIIILTNFGYLFYQVYTAERRRINVSNALKDYQVRIDELEVDKKDLILQTHKLIDKFNNDRRSDKELCLQLMKSVDFYEEKAEFNANAKDVKEMRRGTKLLMEQGKEFVNSPMEKGINNS